MTAKIILDSINPDGVRLTTVEMTYHRFIHPEWMTYRTFSRNSGSSRAIPVEKTIARVEADIAYPFKFGAAQKGMQSGPEIEEVEQARLIWEEAAQDAVTHAKRLAALGVHKEIVNRVLEPFMWHTVLFTATSFNHIIRQRVDLPGAQEEITRPVIELREALSNSIPKELEWGEWHIPYMNEDDYGRDTEDQLKLSVARCARVSYLNHGGETDINDDFRLTKYLLDQEHLSPFEHQAKASVFPRRSNFAGWDQLRKRYEHA